MKKYILIALSICSLSINADAQFRVGPEVGVNIGSISRELSGDLSGFTVTNSTRANLRAGAIAEVPLLNNLTLQPGLFYTTRSTKSNVSVFIFDIEQTYSINYLELPVNLQYKTGNPGEGRLFVGIGPYIGYVIGGFTNTEVGGSGFSLLGGGTNPLEDLANGKEKISTGTDSTDEVRPFDFGANFNVGYELPMGLIFRAQIGMGLLNTAPLSDAAKQKNWAGCISIAYLFNPGKATKPE